MGFCKRVGIGARKTQGPLPTVARKCYSPYSDEGRNVPQGPTPRESEGNTDPLGAGVFRKGAGLTPNVVL